MEKKSLSSQLKFRELKEEAFNRLHALQLKKNHPVEGGDPTDKEIDKEMDEIFKNSENFLGNN
tara:strand:+ start:548 stop:736 length:189 start_codon:yes stop_codon:yes gene_type:complete